MREETLIPPALEARVIFKMKIFSNKFLNAYDGTSCVTTALQLKEDRIARHAHLSSKKGRF